MDDKQLVRIVLTTDEDYEEIKDSVMIGACLEETPKRITIQEKQGDPQGEQS